MIEGIPLPTTDNPVDAPFWEGAALGELRVQRCEGCGELRFPPRPMCPRCRSRSVGWQQMAGRGSIWSFVVPHPPLLPAFAEYAPYTVALVALEEAPQIRLVGALLGHENEELGELDPRAASIGAPVRAVFRQMADDVHLLYWVVEAR